MKLSQERSIELFRQMLTIRYFEQGVWKVYANSWMPGLAHLYIGEEAVAVGVCAALRQDDTITSTHRGHGHCIAKGGKPKEMMAELMGKVNGYCKGKGGSMHIADPKFGILGANGIVGGGFGIATGAGLSAKLLGQDRVSVCFFGDGASNEGLFHEAVNLAAVWRLPVVFVCENNLYGMSTAPNRTMLLECIADRAVAYGIPGTTVDGNDVLAVYDTTTALVERARRGEGPSLLECQTYRWSGHHVGDPGTTYRSTDEVNAWKARCPIKRWRGYLIEHNYLTSETADEIEKQVEQEIEDAIDYGRNSPFPPLEELYTDIFINPIPGSRQ